MKATTLIGIALIGLAFILVGLNFFLPNWAAGDGGYSAASPLPTLGALSRFAESPEDAVANGETPGTQRVVHNNDRIIIRHQTDRLPGKSLPAPTQTPGPAILAPLAAPTLMPGNASSGIPVIDGNETGTTGAEKTTMLIVPSPSSLSHPAAQTHHKPQAKHHRRKKPLYTHKSLTNDDLLRIRVLRQSAERDAIRRTAIGIAQQSMPGTHVQSADLETLDNGAYRVLLVEQNPHGTVVETMTFQSTENGFTATERHVISNTSDPSVGEPGH